MATNGISKARAIQNALARLGMQASPAQVVAALAGFGIDVNERLVRQVKVDMLKEAAQVERQRVKAPKAARPQVRRPPKVPPRRSYRS
jgi:hypothetical protein